MTGRTEPTTDGNRVPANHPKSANYRGFWTFFAPRPADERCVAIDGQKVRRTPLPIGRFRFRGAESTNRRLPCADRPFAQGINATWHCTRCATRGDRAPKGFPRRQHRRLACMPSKERNPPPAPDRIRRRRWSVRHC